MLDIDKKSQMNNKIGGSSICRKQNCLKHKVFLARGLNFAVAPTALLKGEFVMSTEKACSQMNQDEAKELRSEVMGILRSAGDPKPNLTTMESQALSELAV